MKSALRMLNTQLFSLLLLSGFIASSVTCTAQLTNYYIPSGTTVTWSPGSNPAPGSPATIWIKGYLWIGQGSSLTINNMNIQFWPGAVVLVDADVSASPVLAGAKLYLNNTTFTNYAPQGPTWTGVRVYGNSTHSQYSIYQAYMEMNRSTISNAWEGVSVGISNTSGNGGILRANTSTFYNNQYGAVILPYTSAIPNRCSFVNCTFTWDNSSPWMSASPWVGLMGQSVNGVGIYGCSFIGGTTPLMRANSYGIQGTDFGFTADQYHPTPTTTIPSLFELLQYGIANYAIKGTQTMNVRNTNFSSNDLGILSSGLHAPFVVGNDFENSPNIPHFVNFNGFLASSLTSYDETIGLLLQTGTGYFVNGNIFNSLASNSTGVLAWKTGSDPNVINGNTYATLGIGNNSNYNNWGFTAGAITGLQFLCNNYGEHIYDCQVALGTNIGTHGICPNQGSSTNPAGNTFGPTSMFETHLYNSGVFTYNYYYDNSSVYNGPVNPCGNDAGPVILHATTSHALCSRGGGTGSTGIGYGAPTSLILSVEGTDITSFEQAMNNVNYYMAYVPLNDSDTVGHRDSLYYWAGQIGTPYGDLLTTTLMIEDGNYASANTLYNNIVSTYSLTGADANEFSIWGRMLMDVMISVNASGGDPIALDSGQVDSLQQIVAGGSMWAHVRAANWLRSYNDTVTIDTLLFTDTSTVTGGGKASPAPMVSPAPVNRVYPNPAVNQLFIDYTATADGDVLIELEDITGRLILSRLLPQSGVSSVDISNLPPGMYLYKITEGKQPKMEGKVVKTE